MELREVQELAQDHTGIRALALLTLLRYWALFSPTL
jgi:hypothetical protein